MPKINFQTYNWVWVEIFCHVFKSSIEDIKVRMNLDWGKKQTNKLGAHKELYECEHVWVSVYVSLCVCLKT